MCALQRLINFIQPDLTILDINVLKDSKLVVASEFPNLCFKGISEPTNVTIMMEVIGVYITPECMHLR